MDFNVTEAMGLLHDYAIQLNFIHDEIADVYDAFDGELVPNSIIIHLDNDAIDINKLAYPIADNLKSYFLSPRHGGAREGAGRPKKEKTVQARIPQSLLGLVLDLKDAYEDLNDFDKQTVRDSFQQVINEALIEGESSNQAYDERQTNI